MTGDVPDLPTLKLPSLSGPLSGFVPVETACTGGSGHKMAAAADPRPPHNPTGSRRRHSAEEKLFSALSAASWTNSARGRAGGRRAKGGHTSQPDAHVHHTHTHAATPCWSWPLFSFHHPLERKRREILKPETLFYFPVSERISPQSRNRGHTGSDDDVDTAALFRFGRNRPFQLSPDTTTTTTTTVP